MTKSMNSTIAALAIALALTLGSVLQARADTSNTFVQDGKSNAVIVIGADASPSEHRGANELQTWIEQISAAKLPILTEAHSLPEHAILVGDSATVRTLGVTPDPTLGNEGFAIKTINGRIVIIGSPVRGAMYGCYRLLNRLGVHWYTPKVTQVPHTPTITLPKLDDREIPAFEYREPFFTEAFDKDWAARNMVNGNSAHLDASTGGRVQYSKHFVHTFDALVPQDLFKTHPEYFPLIDGKRKGGYVQRCLTNPDVLTLSIAAVNKWMDQEPDATIFSVSQNDCGDFCQCPRCTALAKKYGGQSGLYLWFVNQVAAAVARTHPHKLIDTLAYQFTEAAPTGIKPLPNVRVRLCPINVCEAHPYETDTHPNTIAFMSRLKSWAAITNTLYIWHYNIDFGHYLMPFADFVQFPDSIRLYKRSGVKGIFFEGDYAPGGGGSDAELRSWVMAKLLWNPKLDANQLVTDWMKGVYGPAWKPMRQWHDLVQAQYAAPDHHLFVYDSPGPLRLPPPCWPVEMSCSTRPRSSPRRTSSASMSPRPAPPCATSSWSSTPTRARGSNSSSPTASPSASSSSTRAAPSTNGKPTSSSSTRRSRRQRVGSGYVSSVGNQGSGTGQFGPLQPAAWPTAPLPHPPRTPKETDRQDPYDILTSAYAKAPAHAIPTPYPPRTHTVQTLPRQNVSPALQADASACSFARSASAPIHHGPRNPRASAGQRRKKTPARKTGVHLP